MVREALKLVATDCVTMDDGCFQNSSFQHEIGSLEFSLRSLLKMTMYNQVSIDFR